MIGGGFLGELGGLELLPITSAEKVTPGSRRKIVRATSGRTHVRVLPRREREWGCSISHGAPQEVQILSQLEEFQDRQLRSLVWYPAGSLHTNVLTPEAASMSVKAWADLTVSGPSLPVLRNPYADPYQVPPFSPEPQPRFLASGSTDPDGAWAHLSMIPVPRQQVVTASVRITPTPGETGYFWVDELRADGRTLQVGKINTSEPERLSMTFETSSETVALTFGVSRSARVTQPALTFTDRLMPWTEGRGCTSAMVEVGARDLIHTGRNDPIYGTAEKVDFTITEIIR